MAAESNNPQIIMNDETLKPGMNFVIVKNWDGTLESLQKYEGLEVMVQKMGFELSTLAETLNRKFSEGITTHSEHNPVGEKTEDVATETIIVNGRPLDRLLVTAYPPAANPNPTEMTKFKSGGEVIFVTKGEAEITYAQGVTDKSIPKTNLQSVRVKERDLVISTNTPNNWTGVIGDKFTFIYFVGNPGGPQTYGDVPKIKIPVE